VTLSHPVNNTTVNRKLLSEDEREAAFFSVLRLIFEDDPIAFASYGNT
jgi:hypothetical protein